MGNHVRWGIIGCGKVTEKKSGPAFQLVECSTLRAVMRRRLDDAKISAKNLGATAWYDSVDGILRDKEVDAIYIATPPGLHREQALACCLAKKPTYIEKPFARTEKEAIEITKAFEDAGVPLFVAHYRRALPKFLKIKSIIDSGEIGKVYNISINLERRYQDDKDHPWLFNPEISGGGKFFDIAPHAIDITVFLAGNFIDVYGMMENISSPHGLEDVAVMSFKTENGILGTANFNFISDKKEDHMIIVGTKGSITFGVHGDEPIMIVSNGDQRFINIKNPDSIEMPMINEIVKYLTGNGGEPCFGRDAIETARIIDTVTLPFYQKIV